MYNRNVSFLNFWKYSDDQVTYYDDSETEAQLVNNSLREDDENHL
jgi:hypothetical protein